MHSIRLNTQPETDGAIARHLYDALGRLQDPPLTCFLDQYDLDGKLLSGSFMFIAVLTPSRRPQRMAGRCTASHQPLLAVPCNHVRACL